MAILTSASITVEVNGKSYDLTANELTKQQEAELDALSLESRDLQKERSEVVQEMQFLANEYDANSVIMHAARITEKVSIALEQKNINSKIKALSKQLAKIDEKNKKFSNINHIINHKRFAMMIEEGEAKAMLVKLVETTNLSFVQLVVEIRKLIASAREKN